MLSLILAGVLLLGGELPGAGSVELFDTDKGRVIETYVNSESFQQTAGEILKGVKGRVQDISPSLEKALILKIPLAPPQRLVVAGLPETSVAEMFIVMPKREERPPWLILITKEDETLLMECDVKAERIWDLLKKSKKQTA